MDYSIEATIKDYEDRLEAVQRALVQAKCRIQIVVDSSYETQEAETIRAELRSALEGLRQQISEIDDIVECLREDREDREGA